MENLITTKQMNYIIKLDNSKSQESLQTLTKKEASILIAKLVRATKHTGKTHKKTCSKKTLTHFSHGYNIGDVLYASWGYEQTNLDFFVIVDATEKSIRIKECVMQKTSESYTSSMSRDVAYDPKTAKPREKSWCIHDQAGKGDIKRIMSEPAYNGGVEYYVNFRHGHRLYKYNGEKLYESWYA